MKTNPYIAGNPVGGGDAFIGRADVLHDVLRALKNPNEHGIVLYGQRRIGKTSVLRELEAQLPAQGSYLPVYFDLQDKAAKPLENVLQELTNRILYTLDLPEWENKDDDFVTIFKQDFLSHVLSQIPEKTLVLLFDEFDVLDTKGYQAGSAFFPYLRNLMTLDAQHLKFVFVIGRRPEDLSNLTLSVFKSINSCHVSLLSKKDTADVIRLSERNDSLHWADEAISKVYELSGGHPFLTQQLGFVIWENLYEDDPEEIPAVRPEDVEQAIPETLNASTNALEWLWDGLGPAERVVASALAEAGPGLISQEKLESCLQESGVRILIGELQNAPKILEEWDLIRAGDGGYRMPTEMLRRWIVERKSLSRVQDEIDRIEPVANSLFQAAYRVYQREKFQEAIPLLRQALGFNPNHQKANLLLAELLLAQGETEEAITVLETLYEYRPAAARPRLIQALLTQAQAESKEDTQLSLYEKVLSVDPEQPEALPEYQRIWEKYGDHAYKKGEFQKALAAYEKANAAEKIKTTNNRLKIEGYYTQALEALKKQEQQDAQKLLVEVLSIEPDFREAARYMYQAVTGIDPVARIEELEQHIQTLETKKEARIIINEASVKKLEPKGFENSSLSLKNFTFETVTVNEQGMKIARKQGEAQQFVEDLGNGVTLEMVAIPGGTFLMGQTEAEKKRLIKIVGKKDYQKYYANELPQHEVTVSPFFMGRYPVTQEQWEAIRGENPSKFNLKGAKRPVEQISWEDAVTFCEQLLKKNGHPYRLPSEAEWEYACRAGTITPFYFGETLTSNLANYNGNYTYASEKKGPYREETTDVGTFPPNAFGLYDMHGNVWEWCADPWHENYQGVTTDGSVWEEDGNARFRLLRGGSWSNLPPFCRCADRDRYGPGNWDNTVGVRVVLSSSWAL